MNKFDPDKPVKQRNGRAARIICTDARGEKPIVALIDYSTAFGCEDEPWLYYSDGRCELGGTSQYDLLNIEEPKLQLPITPGRYRMRNGCIALIKEISDDPERRLPVTGDFTDELGYLLRGECWALNGKYYSNSSYENPLDLVERLPDEEEELRKTQFESRMKETSVTLESLNTKLDELLRRVG